MKFRTAILAGVAPAFMLAACAETPDKAGDDGSTAAEVPADKTDDGKEGGGEETPAEAGADTTGKPDIVKDPTEKAAIITRLTGTYACEDQGDVEVTFREYSDGTGTLSYQNMSEMAESNEASVTKLTPASGSAGDNGELASSGGESSVEFLADGRVEVTEGTGGDAIKYACTKTG